MFKIFVRKTNLKVSYVSNKQRITIEYSVPTKWLKKNKELKDYTLFKQANRDCVSDVISTDFSDVV